MNNKKQQKKMNGLLSNNIKFTYRVDKVRVVCDTAYIIQVFGVFYLFSYFIIHLLTFFFLPSTFSLGVVK